MLERASIVTVTEIPSTRTAGKAVVANVNVAGFPAASSIVEVPVETEAAKAIPLVSSSPTATV